MISEPPQVVAEGSSLLAVPILEGMFMVPMSVFERPFGDPKISLDLFGCKQCDFCFIYDLLGLTFTTQWALVFKSFLAVTASLFFGMWLQDLSVVATDVRFQVSAVAVAYFDSVAVHQTV